jgi:hypothetical protein
MDNFFPRHMTNKILGYNKHEKLIPAEKPPLRRIFTIRKKV